MSCLEKLLLGCGSFYLDVQWSRGVTDSRGGDGGRRLPSSSLGSLFRGLGGGIAGEGEGDSTGEAKEGMDASWGPLRL